MDLNSDMAIETTRELFDILVNQGLDKDLLLQKSGIDFDFLQKAEGRFPVQGHLRLWQAADDMLKQTAMGLRMGSFSDPYNRGIVGLVFQASRDLKSAVVNKIRYSKILADHVTLSFSDVGSEFSVTYSIQENYFHRYEIERVFAGFLNWVSVYVDKKISPERLQFQFPKPDCHHFYEQYFRCPMLFDQLENKIILPQWLLDVRNPKYNDYLYGILVARAEAVLSKLDRKVDFVSSIKSAIAGRLNHGNFSATEIAAAHHISVRTLHRRLGENAITYQDILDEVRKEMTFSYLCANDYNQDTIFQLIGYSDVRAFLRAFKRWTGTSPRLYAASQR